MKKILIEEHKQILISLLKYITEVCLKNDIKYTLIGGSLIGSIRNKGIIPWDDDIDIILLPEDYERLIKVLQKSNNRYTLLNNSINNEYYYPFCKLTDNRTIMKEKCQKSINGYGIYLDIFRYNYISNFTIIRFFQYYYIVFLKKLLAASTFDKKIIKEQKNIIKRFKNYVSIKIGTQRILRYMDYFYRKTNKKRTKYLLSNWPTYGLKKEIQKTNNFENYKIVKFENIDAMITENYDTVLKTTFGDYMKLPPKEKRVSNHSFIAYWRDDNEEIKK